MWVVDYLHNRSGEGILKRDNAYYLERLRKLRPDIYADFKSGRISSVAEALDVSGIKPRRTALQQLQSAWSKADPTERDTFRQMIGCVPASAGQMTGSVSASTGSPFHVDRKLTPAAIAQISAIMTRRDLRMGQVMAELGFSPLNVSLGNALSQGTKLRPEVLDRLEAWLSKFGAGTV